MLDLRIADAIIRNIYANNPGKLAAWISARVTWKEDRI